MTQSFYQTASYSDGRYASRVLLAIVGLGLFLGLVIAEVLERMI